MSSAKPLREIQVQPRSCEACQDSLLQPVVEWSHVAITRSQRWLFHNRIVICERCGFVFLSPSFQQAELLEYYGDSFARFNGQALDFDPQKRIQFIESVIHDGSSGVIELGGNANSPFQDLLRERFGEVTTYEPNAECESDFSDVSGVPSGLFGLVVHYFILEHIPSVRAFLRECHRLLRPEGIMIIEVPDLRIYPRDIAALILHEHCNHFTIENLAHLAALEKFSLVSSSETLCSRSFGFVAAFRREEDPVPCQEADRFAENRLLLATGVERMNSFKARLTETRHRLDRDPACKVLLWGANDNLMKFLPGDDVPVHAVLVDSDPRKAEYHPHLRAQLPQNAIASIQEADELVLFTRLHAPKILEWIAEHAGRRFDSPVILDY